jgi:phosphoribosylformylglycinamidine synthase
VGGNVSFYNEDDVKKTAIKATPVIMIVGIIEGEKKIITLPFKEVGNEVFLIGETKAELGGSEYCSVIHNLEGGIPPTVDEKKIQNRWDFLFELYRRDLVKANHDANKGGILITISEMCFKNKIGVDLDFTDCFNEHLRDDEFLFSESVGRFVIESSSENHDIILDLAKKFNVNVQKIGVLISKPIISVNGLKSGRFNLDLEKMKELFDSAIPNLMEI